MADILHDFIVEAPGEDVFRAITTPQGLDVWWTKRSAGEPRERGEYELWFGPQHDWRATVTRCVPGSELELEMVEAEEDWLGTRVGFVLVESDGGTRVRFHHRGWRQESDHFRASSYCWAMYLRLLKRYVEHGEVVPYEKRLDA